jgi:hypothetical protein
MRSGATLACVLALAIQWSPQLAGSAAAAEPVRVAVDWRDVKDDAVARCGLSRLRSGTIERLVEQGNAVVESVGEDGVSVRVTSDGDGLRIRAALGEVVREDKLEFEGCDATFVLEAITRIAELVTAVASTQKTPAVQPEAPPEGAGARPSPPKTVAVGFLDATGKLTTGGDLQGGGGVGGFAFYASGMRVGGRGELTGAGSSGVTILEVTAAITAAYHPRSSLLGLRVEAGPLLHLASSDARSVQEMDGVLGAGLEIEQGAVFGQVLFYGRLRRFEHVKGGEEAFDTGHAGLILRIGAQLSGS